MTAPAPGPADCLTGDPDACMTEVGALIRAARKAAEEDQAAVAARVGVTQAGVSRWESGERDPGVTGLIRIAEALGIPAATLLPAAHQAGDEALGAAIARVIAERDRFARELGEARRALALAMTPGALEGAAVVAAVDDADALRRQLAKVHAIAFRPGMSHMLKLRALHELLDPSLKPPADREELRVALANLTDRAEASRAITEDEADEYRKLTAKEGD
jgi:transcriptional regulator with XRE-family HTH domain